MDFYDIDERDRACAFFGWWSVSMAKQIGDIPEKYWKYFDDRCECGSENIIKKNLKAMTCCDPKCPVKLGYAIAELLSRFGVKGLQQATCSKIYSAFREKDKYLRSQGKDGILIADSYVAVLAVDWKDYPASISSTAKGVEFFNACRSLGVVSLTFPDLVSKLAIPSIGDSATKLMANIKNFNELLGLIKSSGSVWHFCSKRGFAAPMVAYNLRNALFDIATADVIFHNSMRAEGILKLDICMTGMVYRNGKRSTKDAFIQECNKLCCDSDGVQLIELKITNAKESNPFILYSNPSSDAKFIAGKNRGMAVDDFGRHPVLMNTDVFYKYLEGVMQKWETQKKTTEAERLKTTFRSILISTMEETLLQNQTQKMTSF